MVDQTALVQHLISVCGDFVVEDQDDGEYMVSTTIRGTNLPIYAKVKMDDPEWVLIYTPAHRYACAYAISRTVLFMVASLQAIGLVKYL